MHGAAFANPRQSISICCRPTSHETEAQGKEQNKRLVCAWPSWAAVCTRLYSIGQEESLTGGIVLCTVAKVSRGRGHAKRLAVYQQYGTYDPHFERRSGAGGKEGRGAFILGMYLRILIPCPSSLSFTAIHPLVTHSLYSSTFFVCRVDSPPSNAFLYEETFTAPSTKHSNKYPVSRIHHLNLIKISQDIECFSCSLVRATMLPLLPSPPALVSLACRPILGEAW